jgi:Na+/H+ antiporter NhaD/arsenite permease-like protein
MLITRRVKPEKVYEDVDWALLAMFAGLFIVVAGVEKTDLAHAVYHFGEQYRLDRIPAMTVFSAVLSNLVSNVPAVLVFKPLVLSLTEPKTAWLTLAMSSTLAGNFTILASVANLIVVEKAKPGVVISFGDYFRAGAPLTLITLAGGAAWLMAMR